MPPLASSTACRASCGWATSMPAAIGALPATMSKPCGVMLQQEQPDDFVIATGETHSVREFVEAAFACVDLDWRKYVVQDSALTRPAEVDLLIGDAGKARRVLGWQPQVTFKELVRVMVEADLELVRRQLGTNV